MENRNFKWVNQLFLWPCLMLYIPIFIFKVADKEYEVFLSHGGPQNHPQLTNLVLKHVEAISRNLHFSQKHLRCLGSRLVYFGQGERHFSDDRADGRETMGNSLGSALLGGSVMEAWTWWTDKKP